MMKNVFSWFNRKGMQLALVLFVLSVLIELATDKGILPPVRWEHSLSGVIFMVAGGLLLFGLLIFGPLYREYGVSTVRQIDKGKHYPRATRWPLIVLFKDFFRIDMRVKFLDSCIYEFNDVDDYDFNKLFGLSFTLLPRIRSKTWAGGKDTRTWFSIGNYIVIKPHHWNSIRFVWNCLEGKIAMAPYVFKNGERVNKPYFADQSGATLLFNTDIYYKLVMSVRKETSEARLIIYEGQSSDLYMDFDVTTMKMPKWFVLYQYLDLYFGGNKTAPHTMRLEEVQSID